MSSMRPNRDSAGVYWLRLAVGSSLAASRSEYSFSASSRAFFVLAQPASRTAEKARNASRVQEYRFMVMDPEWLLFLPVPARPCHGWAATLPVRGRRSARVVQDGDVFDSLALHIK